MKTDIGKRIKRSGVTLFLIIAITLATFGVVDFLSTFFIDSRSPFEQIFPVENTRLPAPYVMLKGKPGGVHNDLGYRGRTPSKAKSGSYRIFLLGGSTVYDGDPPIAELLEGLFHQGGLTSLEVYNFGVVSSNSGMDLARIVFQVIDYDPDYVIFYNGGNDMILPLGWDPRPGYPFNFMAYERNPLLETRRQYDLMKSLALGSNIFRVASQRFPGLNDYLLGMEDLRRKAGFDTAPWRQAIAEQYLRNAQKAQKLLCGVGSPFAVFFQPIIYDKRSLSDAEKKLCLESARPHFESIRGMIRQGVAGPYGKLNFYDMSGIYDKETGDVFTDIIHTNQRAREVMAREIHRRLDGLVRQDMAAKATRASR